MWRVDLPKNIKTISSHAIGNESALAHPSSGEARRLIRVGGGGGWDAADHDSTLPLRIDRRGGEAVDTGNGAHRAVEQRA
jgi:hypothetical protein